MNQVLVPSAQNNICIIADSNSLNLKNFLNNNKLQTIFEILVGSYFAVTLTDFLIDICITMDYDKV